jgi:hypothetical protein
VANNVLHFILLTKLLKTALAIEYPSKVDVPLPSSSIITNDLFDPYYKIFLVSSISTKNVLFPSKILSNAPNLVNILSTGEKWNFSAGTKHPICANITAKHVYLSNVDLPPIFGPVINNPLAGSYFVQTIVLLGMNFFF